MDILARGTYTSAVHVPEWTVLCPCNSPAKQDSTGVVLANVLCAAAVVRDDMPLWRLTVSHPY